MKFATLRGYPIERIIEELDRQLEDNAYKPIPGGADLTDIRPAYMYKEFNRVFGPCGVGWRYGYDDEHINYASGDKSSWTPVVWIQYRYVNESGEMFWSEKATMPGYNRNKNSGIDSLKGAITSGLGAAGSLLGWQMSVYMGKRSHKSKYPGDMPETKVEAKKREYSDDTSEVITFLRGHNDGELFNGTSYGLLTRTLCDMLEVKQDNPFRYKVLGETFGVKWEKGTRMGTEVGKLMLKWLQGDDARSLKVQAALKEVASKLAEDAVPA